MANSIRPEPGEHVGLAQHAQHPRAGVPQQQIAGDVAQGLVDRSEAREVDAQHGGHPIAAAAAVEHRLEAVEERRAVRQPRQGIVPRQRHRLLLRGRRRRAVLPGTAPADLDPGAESGAGACRQHRQQRRGATEIARQPADAEQERHGAGRRVQAELDQKRCRQRLTHLSRSAGDPCADARRLAPVG